MPSGIYLVGSNGNVMIDSEVGVNYCITGYGTITLNNPPSGAFAASYGEITVAATQPFFALRCTSGYVWPGRITNNGNGTWTQRVWGPANAQVNYYVMDWPSTLGSFGVQAFNSQGVCTFDATRLNPNVLYAGGASVNNLPTGVYAVGFNQIGSFMNPGSQPGQNYQYYTAARATDTGFLISSQAGYLWPNNITMLNSISASMLLIDVTNVF